jgi:hypothetical protein
MPSCAKLEIGESPADSAIKRALRLLPIFSQQTSRPGDYAKKK